MLSRTAVVTAAAVAVVSIPLVLVNSSASAQVSGDFDNDGFDDLAIGIPGETVGGDAGAGAVAVIYGSNTRLKANGDQLWTEDAAGMLGEAEPNEHFGAALAVGDFNADNFDDLAIGIPGQTVNGHENAGAVVILLGSNHGLTNTANNFITQTSEGMGSDPGEDHRFGAALCTGDFDGDHQDDLAVGVPGSRVGIHDQAGMVFVLPGFGIGVNTFERQIWTQAPSAVEDAPEEGDHFGAALAAADFNNDGFFDLAIGVPDEEVHGRASAGAVHILKGTADGLTAVADRLWTQDSDDITDATEIGDRFGAALAAGHFDGDDLADLAIAAPSDDIGANADAGVVHVLYGKAAGLTADGSQYWTPDFPGLGNGAQAGDMFGAALAAGNFNGDNRDDLAIGIPGETIGNRVGCGAVVIMRGTAATGLTNNGAQFWHQNSPDVLDACETGDDFGASLGAGDFNGDDRDDLAIGIPLENLAGKADCGAIQIFYGTAGLLSASNDELWHQNVAGVNGACGVGDNFGGANGG